MKKYTLFLLVFSLAFSLLNITSIKFANADVPGCIAGDNYSRTTGQPCDTTPRSGECAPGDLFSSITGKPCGNTVPIPFSCPQFSIGTKGQDVRAFQVQLNAQGESVKVDGSYGPKTEAVAKKYCKNHTASSVVISGVKGPQTLDVNQQGTWTVTAYDKNGGNLTYAATWGDEVAGTGAGFNGLPKSARIQQTATFTHSYSGAGTYKPTFTVISENTIRCFTTPCPSNAGSAQTSLSVNVGNVVTPPNPGSSIAMLSPNGGETWAKGTTQTIQWQDNIDHPMCPAGSTNCYITSAMPRYYDITLQSFYPPCTSNMCPMYSQVSHTIAKGVSGLSYNWTIPNCTVNNTCSSNFDIPAGSYIIQVCQTGTSICGSSDKAFNIISGTTNIQIPTISYLSPVSGPVGTKVQIMGSGFDHEETICTNSIPGTCHTTGGLNTIYFNGTAIMRTSYNTRDTEVDFVVPNISTGIYHVYVTNRFGTSNSADFTVIFPIR